MMGENITFGGGDFHIDAKDRFTENSSEILWFSGFKGWIGAPEAKLKAEWMTPAGEIFKTEKFTTRYGNNRFGWAKLDIRNADKAAVELKGEWKVKIYWDDELIDEKIFYIGERKFVEPTQIATWDGSIRLAKVHIAKGEWERAAEQVKAAQRLDRAKSEAYLLLGDIYNQQGEPEEAILQFSKAQELKADAMSVHSGLAEAYIKLEMPDDAIRECEAALIIQPASKETLDKLNELKKLKAEAASAPSKAPKKKNSKKDFIYIGDAKIPIVARAGDITVVKLQDLYFHVRDTRPKKDQENKNLMVAEKCSAMKAQDFIVYSKREAYNIYLDCAESYPASDAANRAAGVFAMLLDEREKALELFLKVVKLLPDDALAHEQYGDALMLQLRNEEAQAEYKTAIQKGHWDEERIRIKITKLTSKKDIEYVKRYLNTITGFNVRDSFVSNANYFDSKQMPSKSDYLYQKNDLPGKVGHVNMDKIYRDFSLMKKFKEFEEKWRKDFEKRKKELEKNPKDPGAQDSAKSELIKFIVTGEAGVVVARARYTEEIENAAKKVSAVLAGQKGLDGVVSNGNEGEDLAKEVLQALDSDLSLNIVPETLFTRAQEDLELTENNLQPEKFFAK